MESPAPKLIDKLWYVLAAIVILMALLVSIARLLTPVLMEHRVDFEKFASRLLSRPVLIHQVEITWHAYEPQIALEGVTVLDPDTKTPTANVDKLEIDFNIWRSILARQVFIQSITLSGMEVTIDHQASGQVQVGDLGTFNMKDTITGQSLHSDAVFGWIFSQPQLILKDIQVHYIAEQYPSRSITLKMLMLRNSATHHVLDGNATLNQEMPVNALVHLGWDGDVRKLPEAKGHVYLYFEGLSLPQWFSKLEWHGVQVRQGLASTKLWMRWDHNRIYNIQNKFEIYNLELYSTVAKKAELISRISGNLGWKLDGNKQTFAADQVLVDFSDHLWPAADVTAIVLPNAQGVPTLNAMHFNYLDLADVRRLALMTTLVPAPLQKTLTALDPAGQLQDVVVSFPADLTDIQNWLIAAKWQNLKLNAWQGYPAFNNFTGSGKWNGKEADITLKSKKAVFTLSQMFLSPLNLENITGNLQINHMPDGSWALQTNNFHADNQELSADIKLGLILPAQAAKSASIDLNTNFALKNAEHITNYLPLKDFNPDLQTWLRAAFAGGSLSGMAILQGNLKDFPFDNNQAGKFLVSAQLKDLNFRYAPDWPRIQHLNGDLTFSGRGMLLDLHSGQLLDVPIKNVRAEIPYIGDKEPLVVDVDSLIDSDLTKGLNFVRHSPLQKTLGKNLSKIELVGPMQLKLSMAIPVKKPETTTINGVINTTNATLTLPAWKLALEKLTGAVQFSDKDLTATNLQAQLFGMPAKVQVATLHNANLPTQTRVDLQSTISVSQVEKLLNKKLSQFATGATAYQIEVVLSSRTEAAAPSDQLTISSDLKGVTLTLPKPYNKTADEQKKSQVAIDLSDNKFLRIKLTYANLLSAALSFQKMNQNTVLYGGEIRLGDNNAAWQTSSGILVSGQVPQFDVAMWRDYFAAQTAPVKPGMPTNYKMLRGIDISAGVLNIMGVQLHSARLQATPVNNNSWDIQINSKEVGGSFVLPMDFAGKTITGNFDHLYINPQMMGKNASTLTPKSIPAMALNIKDVRYEDMQFGHVSLAVQPDNSGLLIKSIQINESDLQLNVTGRWTESGTSLQGTVTTTQVSNVLAEWGFNSSNLKGSTGDAKFNLSWPGPPYAPGVGRMSGNLSIKLGEGKIINLSDSTNSKMGLGRLLNILSLTSLPRRLSFNESSEGYDFDSLNGDFSFSKGNAYTDNMHIEGPVASVSVKGRIGLQAKDLDLKLGVVAHVTGSLPVVAALAGGPIVGVAAWMVDKVVSREVSQAASSNYTVTGSWANPNWQKLSLQQNRVNGISTTHA